MNKAARALANCHSILDLRDLARRRLPNAIFNILESSSETEVTARGNTEAFDKAPLIPNCVVDVSSVRTATRILGQNIEWPVLCSPTGGTRAFHLDGELAVARAAARAGTLYGLSTGSTCSLETVAVSSPGPKFFQLYICKNRDLTRELIVRAKSAGYAALCLTVDTPVAGKHERVLRSGLLGPRHRWPGHTLMGFAQHPSWALKRRGKAALRSANFVDPRGEPAQLGFLEEQLDPSITWKDVREVIDLWGGPFALKGVMSAADARRAADTGVTAVIVSNHGGRQLDGCIAAFDALPDIVRAVGDRVEVILDSGIRRGVHVLKALARGAKACAIGRPYLYGLSAGGEEGVTRALDILRTEFIRAMQLSGCADLGVINGTLLRDSA